MLPGLRPFFLSFVSDGPFLLARQRKDELEQRMSALQESRRELMVQLEGLMKLLKVRACSRAPPAPTCLVHPPPQCSSASPVMSNRRRREAYMRQPSPSFQVTLHSGSRIPCNSHLCQRKARLKGKVSDWGQGNVLEWLLLWMFTNGRLAMEKWIFPNCLKFLLRQIFRYSSYK